MTAQPSVDPLDEAIAEATAEIEASREPDGSAEEADTSAEEQPEGDLEAEDEGGEPEVEEPEEVDDTDPESEGEEAPDDTGDGEVDETDGDEVEGDDEDGEEDDDDSPAAELDEESTFRLPNGDEVTGAELRDGYLRQADYTRKTQELAAERTKVENLIGQVTAWYEERQEDPAGWIAEIAGSTDDPYGTLAETVATTPNPTATVAWMIRNLAEQGSLDQEFVETFGLEGVVGAKADQAEQHNEVEQLRKRLDEREQQDRIQKKVQQLENEWTGIVQSEGLEFQSPEAEQQAKVELLTFMKQRGIGDLRTGYAALAYEHQRQNGSQQQKQQTGPEPDPQEKPDNRERAERAAAAVKKKRATRAMSRKPGSQEAPKPRAPGDLDAAIAEAAAELDLELV